MKTTVGAIRWDAWGTRDIGPQVRATLSLQRFHFRLPFYAEIIGNDSIFIPPYSQEIIDREITLAADAGLDYWAFCWYPHTVDGGLDSARLLYQQSEIRNRIKWCPILCVGGFDFATDGPVLARQMQEENFFTVRDGRPLVYAFGGDKSFVDKLREVCRENGTKDPVIYRMGWGNIWEQAREMGADGVSCYANGAYNGVLYQALAKAEKARWDHDRDQGHMPVIPTVTTGWDKRPRYFHPVTWEFKSTNLYPDHWCYQATDTEIADHLRDAIRWTKENAAESPDRSVIIYAWNENDEGGWIMPTLKEMSDYGHPVRLDAVKRVLKEREEV